MPEQQLPGAEPITARLAAAVTLASGRLLITGGKNQEKETYLVSSDLTNWEKRAQMHHGRIGHAAARVVIDKEEQVIVAGGWDSFGAIQNTVEIYSVSRDSWTLLPNLPIPRADFALQVAKSTTALYPVFQVDNLVVTTVGGFAQHNPANKDKPTYPLAVKLDLGNWGKGWMNVTVRERQVRRNGFMSAKVPVSWTKAGP